MDVSRLAFVIGMACCISLLITTTKGNYWKCVSDCSNMANGEYQSCRGCSVYVTCTNELIYDNRPCPADLVWDDKKKRCEYTSNTCSENH